MVKDGIFIPTMQTRFKTSLIGERIVFKSVTRWSSRTAVRIVGGVLDGRPTVRFGGYGDFIVRPHEVKGVVGGTLSEFVEDVSV